MWRNFRFLHICHAQKFEISPHDRFFLHGHRLWCPWQIWGRDTTQLLLRLSGLKKFEKYIQRGNSGSSCEYLALQLCLAKSIPFFCRAVLHSSALQTEYLDRNYEGKWGFPNSSCIIWTSENRLTLNALMKRGHTCILSIRSRAIEGEAQVGYK